MTRRREMLIGCVAFIALGAALGWSGLQRFAPRPGGLPPDAWNYLSGSLLLALGTATVVAAVLVVRARWTPPPPGDPVERSPDQAG